MYLLGARGPSQRAYSCIYICIANVIPRFSLVSLVSQSVAFQLNDLAFLCVHSFDNEHQSRGITAIESSGKPFMIVHNDRLGSHEERLAYA